MRQLIAVLAAGAAAVLTAAPAHAHVEPSVEEIPAGSWATMDFTVEHGCEGSPTVMLEFQVPPLITDVVPVEKDGWSASVTGDVVTFEGGPLPDDQQDTFAVEFTVPTQEGETLTFPFIQTCEEGSIEWIQLDGDADRPAPMVVIGAPDPSAPTPPSTTSPVPDDDPSATSTTLAAEDPTSTAPATIVTAPDSADDSAPSDDEGASPWLAVVGVLAVTGAIVGGVIYLRKRKP